MDRVAGSKDSPGALVEFFLIENFLDVSVYMDIMDS